MSARRTSFATNVARVVFGLVALALLGALLFTLVRGRDALGRAEDAAEQRATRWASSALFDALTPEQVSGEILGAAYRELLTVVQARILGDDRVARVRIWNPDGVLVFSSDQRDKTGEFVAEDDPHIQAALQGEVVSVPMEATLGREAGLAGADEKLLQTFVPLHLVGETGTSGVVQIDQRYSAIEDEAASASSGIRLALVAGLTVAVIGFLITLRRRPAPVEGDIGLDLEGLEPQDREAAISRIERAEASAAAATERVAELEGRARAAEERAARAEAALAQALEARAAGERAAEDTGAGERLSELEEERQRLTDELARVRAALAEREAELTSVSGGAGTDRAAELEAEREQIRAELEAALRDRNSIRAELETALREVDALRAELAGAREAAAERDTTMLREAQERVASLEAALREREEVATGARAELEAVKAELEASRAELEAAKSELRTLRADLEEARAQLSAGVAAAAEAGPEDVEALRARIAELEAARRSDIADLQRAQEALANTQYEAAQAIRRAKELERELAALGAGEAMTPEPVEERPTIGERLAARARGREPAKEPSGEEPERGSEEPERGSEEPELGAPPETEEGLSLRERLARAAAARHRPPGQDTER